MADHGEWFGRNNELVRRLLLILGVRKQELTRARWTKISLAAPRWQIPREKSKTGRGIIIPLPALAVEHFKELQGKADGSEWVLPARRWGRRRLAHLGPDTLNRAE